MDQQITAPKQKNHYTAIPLRSLMHIAWANIANKKLRSLLTIAGVVIGIGAIFFLLSFGIGLQQLVANEVIGDESIKSVEITSPNSKILKLNDEVVNKVKGFPYVNKVGTLHSFPGTIVYQGGEVGAITYGVDANYISMTQYEVIAGRLLQSNDQKSVVISKGALTSLGSEDAKAAIGQKIKVTVPLNNVESKDNPVEDEFTVVGVVDSGSGTEVYIPNYVFTGAGVEVFSQVKLIAADTRYVPQLREQIGAIGFETSSPIDTLEQINQIFKFFNIVLVGFGAIGMIVAVLGMFNTLTISLLERTQEIGLMIALGARNTDMRKLFIFEATLLSLIGSIIGIVMAIVAGYGVNTAMNQLASRRGVDDGFTLFATPLWLVASLVGFMVAVGLIVVFFPARRAEKINPIDALRRE
jgi:ABC-type antimicrobial peptide transport system permease subunit